MLSVKTPLRFPPQLLRLLLLGTLPLLFTACQFYACYLETGAEIYPPTEAENVQLYVAEPEQTYRVLGAVAADGIRQEDVLEYLQKRVTEIGADAVIQMKLDKMSSFSSRVSVSGVAVKFVEY